MCNTNLFFWNDKNVDFRSDLEEREKGKLNEMVAIKKTKKNKNTNLYFLNIDFGPKGKRKKSKLNKIITQKNKIKIKISSY